MSLFQVQTRSWQVNVDQSVYMVWLKLCSHKKRDEKKKKKILKCLYLASDQLPHSSYKCAWTFLLTILTKDF